MRGLMPRLTGARWRRLARTRKRSARGVADNDALRTSFLRAHGVSRTHARRLAGGGRWDRRCDSGLRPVSLRAAKSDLAAPRRDRCSSAEREENNIRFSRPVPGRGAPPVTCEGHDGFAYDFVSELRIIQTAPIARSCSGSSCPSGEDGASRRMEHRDFQPGVPPLRAMERDLTPKPVHCRHLQPE